MTSNLEKVIKNYLIRETNIRETLLWATRVLIKDDDKPRADVIDGQQRLTTLTILFAVVASYLAGDNRSNCYKYLREPGNELEGLAPLPRLHLRQKDQDFFHKYIQNVNLDEITALDAESLPNESQQHIKANCELFIKRWMQFLEKMRKGLLNSAGSL